MSSASECDVAIIGGGPGGYVAAIRAAQLGAKVILVEKDELGGICLNKGCIPTKALLASSELFHTITHKSKEHGIRVDKASIDFKAAMRRKDRVVKFLVKGVESLLKSNAIELMKGVGTLAGHGEIYVTKKDGGKVNAKAKKIIIATGTRHPDLKTRGFGRKEVIFTDDALELADPPESMLVVGGGLAGVELATINSNIGVDVTVAEMLPQLLPAEDEEIAAQLRSIMEKKGIKVLTGAKFKGMVHKNGDKRAVVITENGNVKVEAEKVVIAFGRVLNSDNIGLEKINVNVEKGRIKVDRKMQTSAPNLYAIGDVVGGLYAHVASREGIVAAENALGRNSLMDYKVVPRCIFTTPEIGAVGMTEEQAKKAGYKVKIGRFPLVASGRARTIGETEGMVKMIADEATWKILGVHVIGSRATELISEAALAIKLGCTVDDVTETIHAHPTVAEALKEAALDVRERAFHMPKKVRGLAFTK